MLVAQPSWKIGGTWQLARQLSQLTGPLAPTELIYGIDPDCPTGPAMAMSDTPTTSTSDGTVDTPRLPPDGPTRIDGI